MNHSPEPMKPNPVRLVAEAVAFGGTIASCLIWYDWHLLLILALALWAHGIELHWD